MTEPTTPAGTPPPAPESVRRRAWQAIILGLLGIGLIGTVFPYGTVLGLVCAVSALVIGIRTRRMARAAKLPTARATVGVVGGSIGLALGLVVTISLAVFWTEFRTYTDCRDGALTVQAKDSCYTDLIHSLEKRVGVKS